jgi:L-seryl-tRNA(Ser) seleniumtransferase
VINATGVVLHTNLGRAPLAAAAVDAIVRVAQGFSNLEYDLESGARGSRYVHCAELLRELTGAEDALVVNNGAAALVLVLNTIAEGRDAIVSRGELVEIGGAFRVPDILARSGARLVEVGTTNRTHVDDYVKAMTPKTRALLKVHRSNFRVTGFTAEVDASELAQLGRAGGAASLYDLGSGLLLDLSRWGLTGEPLVRDAVASGVDLVVFSGDKLLGGPQAGIMLGAKPAIEACRADPLARAVRADKYTLAALEATLALYRDPERARTEIPTLRMLTEDVAAIKDRGEAIIEGVRRKGVGGNDVGKKAYTAELVEGFSEVGGGSFPEAKLPTWLVQLKADTLTADSLIQRLRASDPPVIARIENDHVVLDPRTILPDQVATVAQAVAGALDG